MSFSRRSAHELYEEDAAAYVLGCLDPDERRAFEAHVVECAACAETVRGLRELTVELACSLPRWIPAPRVRGRVLSSVRMRR